MVNNTASTNDSMKLVRRARLYHGLAARVSRLLGVSSAHVSQVISGIRRSSRVEDALAKEVSRIERRIHAA